MSSGKLHIYSICTLHITSYCYIAIYLFVDSVSILILFPSKCPLALLLFCAAVSKLNLPQGGSIKVHLILF